MWVSHMALPAAYRDCCVRLVGRLVAPGPGAWRLEDEGHEFAETRRLYEHHFGGWVGGWEGGREGGRVYRNSP